MTVQDISESDPGFNPHQHCTFPFQDGDRDYSFSHTAQYCGRPQPRRCGCAFDYSPFEKNTIMLSFHYKSTQEVEEIAQSIRSCLSESHIGDNEYDLEVTE